MRNKFFLFFSLFGTESVRIKFINFIVLGSYCTIPVLEGDELKSLFTTGRDYRLQLSTQTLEDSWILLQEWRYWLAQPVTGTLTDCTTEKTWITH